MNGPYYTNHSRSTPVHKPKVVSIPVHFISSDHNHQPQTTTNKHSSSALKIQKVFKGHTVRNALNKIFLIKNQVNEIEKRLQNDAGFVRMLRNDAKERLRVNETLMSLLFKLDSVAGVENGVREVRKCVAKKAVALQERIDSIGLSFEEEDGDVSNGEETEVCDVSNGIGDNMNEEGAREDFGGGDVINDARTELRDVSNGIVDVDDDYVSNKDREPELVVNDVDMNEDSSMKECDDDVSRNNVDSTNQKTFEDYVDDVSNSIPNKVDEEYVKDVVVNDDVSNNVENQESYVDSREDLKQRLTKKCDDNDVSRRCCDKGMVEKLVNDNAKMMRLMIQISERNEMQTRIINSLSKRVELLEKAFIMSDKSRRRKKSYTRREKDGFCI